MYTSKLKRKDPFLKKVVDLKLKSCAFILKEFPILALKAHCYLYKFAPLLGVFFFKASMTFSWKKQNKKKHRTFVC